MPGESSPNLQQPASYFTMCCLSRCPTSVALAVAFLTSILAGSLLAEEKYTPLFDGKSLDGWTTKDGKPVTKGWAVEQGVLVRVGGGGSIYSSKEFADFELRFDWRISKRGNSGIKYRVQFYPKGVYGPGMLGCEYQIWDDQRPSSANKSAGALYGLYAPNDNKQLKPLDEYNRSRIVAVGPKLQHWLNGELVVEADQTTADWRERVAKSKFGVVKDVFQNRTGRIELQDHGSKVWFQKILIRPLSELPQSSADTDPSHPVAESKATPGT